MEYLCQGLSGFALPRQTISGLSALHKALILGLEGSFRIWQSIIYLFHLAHKLLCHTITASQESRRVLTSRKFLVYTGVTALSVMASQIIRSVGPPLFKPSTSGSLAEACIKPRIQRSGFRALPAARRPEVVSQRYGSANEPPPQLAGAKSATSKDSIEQSALPRPSPKAASSETKPMPKDVSGPGEKRQRETEATEGPAIKTGQAEEVQNKQEPKREASAAASGTAPSQILSKEPPISGDAEDKPPHLQAPPYTHHFDTFTLVRALEKDGGFTEEQAVTAMKAVRLILADNMDLARDGIVAKGDSEMVCLQGGALLSSISSNNRMSRPPTFSELLPPSYVPKLRTTDLV